MERRSGIERPAGLGGAGCGGDDDGECSRPRCAAAAAIAARAARRAQQRVPRQPSSSAESQVESAVSCGREPAPSAGPASSAVAAGGQDRRDPARHEVVGPLGDVRPSAPRRRPSRRPVSSPTSRTPRATRPQLPTIADQMITSGVNVLMIVNLDSESGAAIQKKAEDAGVATIDYDRLTLGGCADVYVSSTTSRSASSRARASSSASPTRASEAGHRRAQRLADGQQRDAVQAGLRLRAQAEVRLRRVRQGRRPAVPDWDNQKGGQIFEQMLTKANGKIDGVLAANDGLGNAAIAVLKKNNLQVPVTGQDATPEGLQNILAGDQCMTVYKASRTRPKAAADAALALANGRAAGHRRRDGRRHRRATATSRPCSRPRSRSSRTTSRTSSPTASSRSRDLCTPELAQACADAGIQLERTGGLAGSCAASHAGAPGAGAEQPPSRTVQGARNQRERRTRTAPILELAGINKSFGPVHVLHDVDFSVYPGEVTALVGDNGAGKSTLVKCVAGVYADRRRRVPASTASPSPSTTPKDAAALGIEIVYQDLALCDNLDIVQNMFLGPREADRHRRSTSRRWRRWRARRWPASRCAPSRACGSSSPSLSGGQRQTVAIAKAVLWNSKVVILDEPTAALGVAQTAQVLDLVRRLAEQRPRRRDHHAQHERRLRGRRPHLRALPGPRRGRGQASETSPTQVVELITSRPLRRPRPRPRRAASQI